MHYPRREKNREPDVKDLVCGTEAWQEIRPCRSMERRLTGPVKKCLSRFSAQPSPRPSSITHVEQHPSSGVSKGNVKELSLILIRIGPAMCASSQNPGLGGLIGDHQRVIPWHSISCRSRLELWDLLLSLVGSSSDNFGVLASSTTVRGL